MQATENARTLTWRTLLRSDMHHLARVAIAISALTVFSAAAAPFYVHLASEAIIERRYPLPVIEEPAMASEKSERGVHLTTIAGCSDCHGANFEGGALNV